MRLAFSTTELSMMVAWIRNHHYLLIIHIERQIISFEYHFLTFIKLDPGIQKWCEIVIIQFHLNFVMPFSAKPVV